MNLMDRLATKFTVGDGCWEWTGSRKQSGYGNFYVDGKIEIAHRVLYELMVGEIPEDLVMDHLCRNRGCVRPDHLEPVTHAENMRRAGEALVACRNGGHSYDEVNTRIGKTGKRFCRACDRARKWQREDCI
jgi:hypothetical protein